MNWLSNLFKKKKKVDLYDTSKLKEQLWTGDATMVKCDKCGKEIVRLVKLDDTRCTCGGNYQVTMREMKR
jgi:DNA-directed RNA polymerase subunit RPC12/RpoP